VHVLEKVYAGVAGGVHVLEKVYAGTRALQQLPGAG
jgi:hypothetical protein